MSDSEPKPVLLRSDNEIYFNGYSLAIGTGDVIVTLLRQGRPVATLNASYTVAKSLAKVLHEAIGQFEGTTEHEIMTVDEIQKFIKQTP